MIFPSENRVVFMLFFVFTISIIAVPCMFFAHRYESELQVTYRFNGILLTLFSLVVIVLSPTIISLILNRRYQSHQLTSTSKQL